MASNGTNGNGTRGLFPMTHAAMTAEREREDTVGAWVAKTQPAAPPPLPPPPPAVKAPEPSIALSDLEKILRRRSAAFETILGDAELLRDSSIECVQAVITPALARKWLERNSDNRKFIPQHIAKITSDIRDGLYVLHHQGIAFDVNGRLVDGQNRLAAVIEADTAIRSLVFFGVTEEGRQGMDQGKVRTGPDVARIGGENLDNLHFAIARMMHAGMSGYGNHAMSSVMANKFFAAHRAPIIFAYDLLGSGGNTPGVRRGPVGAVLARAWYSEDHDALREFGAILITGESNKHRDRTAVALRNRLLISDRRRDADSVYRLTERALRAWLDGEALRIIREVTEEQFLLPGEEK